MLQNPTQLIQQFQKFRAEFQGDPQAEVQRLLASGRLSQAQLNQLQSMAYQLQRIMNDTWPGSK